MKREKIDQTTRINSEKQFEFIQAIVRGNVKKLQNFLESDFDFRYKNQGICLAAETGNIEILEILIQAGCDVNAYKNYPIQKAAENGDFDVVKFLVKNGATITDQSLELAREKNHIDIVKFLENPNEENFENNDNDLDIDI